MMNLLRTTLSLAALLALALPAAAQNDFVKLKDGKFIKGEAISYDEPTQTLNFKMEDGTSRGFKLDELDKRSVYLVNQSKVPKNDATKQIRLANLARDAELFAHAMRHYAYAEKADPARKPEIDKERATLRQLAAAYGMRMANEARSKGDKAGAEKWLMKIVEKVPDEPQAKEASAILEQTYAQARGEKEAKAQSQASEQLKKDLQPGKKNYDDMVRKTQEGLTASTSGSKATNSWDSALSDGQRALDLLERLMKKYPDPKTKETLEGYRGVVTGQMVELHLHLASSYTTRSSYNDALAEVNKGLALDPKNQECLAARARIEQAASESGWRW